MKLVVQNIYTVKFSLMEPSVPLIKILKVPLYQEFQYIESKFIIVYNNVFQIKIPLYQDFTYVPLYRGSVKLNFTVYLFIDSIHYVFCALVVNLLQIQGTIHDFLTL